MEDKLERVYEYRLLMGKRDDRGIPLSPVQAGRLERLTRSLPPGVPTIDERNPATLVTTELPARVALRGRLVLGMLRSVAADGLAIALDEPPLLGEGGVVQVTEPLYGVEYSFPGRIIARVLRGTPSIGWSFDGVPSQRRAGSRSSGVWRSGDAPSPPISRQPKDHSAGG